MNKLAVVLGVIVLGVTLAVAPMPLTMSFKDPARAVTIYPNVLLAVPLLLLGALLLLYGITLKDHSSSGSA